MFSFDGANKLIIMDLGTTTLDAKDLYSRWKDWVILSDNAKFDQAMEAVGGNPTSATNFVPSFFFVINGWKIRPQEANHTLVVTGNLANENGIGSPFVSTVGSFNVLIDKNTSESQTVSTTGSSGIDQGDIDSIVDAVKPDLTIINNGVKNASKLIPHGTNLTS